MSRRDDLVRMLDDIDAVVEEAISHIHCPSHAEPNERARSAKMLEQMELARETVETELSRMNWR